MSKTPGGLPRIVYFRGLSGIDSALFVLSVAITQTGVG